MKEAATAVIEFNHDLLGIAPRPIAPMSDDEMEHLGKCLVEEFIDELGVAYAQQDVVKAVDALLDGMYFAIGGLYKMGLNADQIGACFLAVHLANMTKKRASIARRAVGDVPDADKPDDFVPAEVEIAKILNLSN